MVRPDLQMAQGRVPNVRLGSLADIVLPSCNVCFTPKSGHFVSATRMFALGPDTRLAYGLHWYLFEPGN